MKPNNDFQALLDALMDDELDAVGLREIENAAQGDPIRTRRLRLARIMQRALGEMGQVKTPALLHARLRSIPQKQRLSRWRAWGVGLAAGLMLMMVSGLFQRGPSQAEVMQTRQQLAVAFAYLDKTSRRVGVDTREQITRSMEQPVRVGLLKATVL